MEGGNVRIAHARGNPGRVDRHLSALHFVMGTIATGRYANTCIGLGRARVSVKVGISVLALALGHRDSLFVCDPGGGFGRYRGSHAVGGLDEPCEPRR
jgi:hypothetical protein